MIIGCIGSRDTPLAIQDQMKKVGEYCRMNGIRVLSGHADGADWAFEQGAQEACTIFLPWNSFNSNLVSKAERIVSPYLPSHEVTLLELVHKFHPSPDRLKDAVLKLMMRNSYMVLGLDLESPVGAIVCWTHGAQVVGGTGQALRIARHYDIPVINMAKMEFSTASAVQSRLLQILSH